MLRIGRYGIAFGRTFWVQTRMPTTVRRFLCFWIFKEARPTDVDKKQQFPTGTLMAYEGRRYRYWGPAPRDIDRGEVVFGNTVRGDVKKGEVVESHNEKVTESKGGER
ncbi:hypothetical protein ES703_97110 [subsurface metagenome]